MKEIDMDRSTGESWEGRPLSRLTLGKLPGACQLCQVEPTCPGVGSEGAEGAVPLTFGERYGGRSVRACAGANLAAGEERAAIV